MEENQIAATPPIILTVSELNRLARDVLERSFPLFWVSGEISNLTRAASGHWYFSLKDGGAQARCIMFKGRNSYLGWIPKEGDKVEARATVTLYEARGDFQLTIEFLQRAGLGTLFEAFELLKAKLQLEGLFDSRLKKPIPIHPRQIGIVTSPNAAALRDVLSTLKRRMPSISVVIYPTPVQGKGADTLIAIAINKASQRAECDVLIVCRGGGSIEDLWQFNEEIVARAIANCKIPTISGVGHETDFTIADFVADARAPTPTAAAELATPDRQSMLYQLTSLQQRLSKQINDAINQRAQTLDYLARRLLSPMQQVKQQANQVTQLHMRLSSAFSQQLQTQQQYVLSLSNSLKQLNPHAVLERGYAFVQSVKGELVTDSARLAKNEIVKITFSKGEANAQIMPVAKNSRQPDLF
ncbi:MAG: exodeoxyribonuclease VII large subunit [Methylophilaceae bacterium]|nr:exodeoxyribonuclease VII large subunit [Methylophilaceae bacterium]